MHDVSPLLEEGVGGGVHVKTEKDINFQCSGLENHHVLKPKPLFIMKALHYLPLCLLTGLLYGLSWPIFEGINLSFLAWFAFVPLFIFLEKNRNFFWKSMGGSYAAMVIFGTISASWLFNFPQAKAQIALIFFLEQLYAAFPFILFFFLQKKLGFQKSVWLFPLLWTVWEWAYLHVEFTMGTHLSAYSQSSNIWLIQYIDVTGMWGISFWLMLFNVLIYKAYQKVNAKWKSKDFYFKIIKISAVMLTLPLLYGAYAFFKYNNSDNKSIQISLIPTQFSADYIMNRNNRRAITEQTLHRTDSIAFAQLENKRPSDLYLWPETGTRSAINIVNLERLLQEATQEWGAALLTGCRGIPENYSEKDQRTFISGALISSTQKETVYHHKTTLCPGQEVIPYHELLAKIPDFPIAENNPHYFKKGQESLPLSLKTQDGQQFQVGVSLCFEQWYPHHWAALARNGADFYTHLTEEAWYGSLGFQQFMANVSRLRTIENRKGTARCANVGLSLFIDPFGRFYHSSEEGTLHATTASIAASKVITWYAQYPNWFPFTCLFVFVAGLAFFVKPEKWSIRMADFSKRRPTTY